MKREYEAPDFVIVEFTMADVLSGSPTENPISSQIGGGGTGGGFDDLTGDL